MLSENTLTLLSALTYRPDAKRQVCLLPLGGIYWEDEMPDLRQIMRLMPEDDRNQTFQLFNIRVKLWNGEKLPADEQLFWDTARSLMPTWALFQRRRISADDRHAQDEAERAATEFVAQIFARADKVSINPKDGLQRFSATFRLHKEPESGPDSRVAHPPGKQSGGLEKP